MALLSTELEGERNGEVPVQGSEARLLTDAPWYAALLDECSVVGLPRDGDFAYDKKNGTTHLYRRMFDLQPPAPGMRITDAVLEMWSDNKSEWWWQSPADEMPALLASDAEGKHLGRKDLFPGYIESSGGSYVLAIQNSNDYSASVDDNPHGTAFRLVVTWCNCPPY